MRRHLSDQRMLCSKLGHRRVRCSPRAFRLNSLLRSAFTTLLFTSMYFAPACRRRRRAARAGCQPCRPARGYSGATTPVPPHPLPQPGALGGLKAHPSPFLPHPLRSISYFPPVYQPNRIFILFPGGITRSWRKSCDARTGCSQHKIRRSNLLFRNQLFPKLICSKTGYSW